MTEHLKHVRHGFGSVRPYVYGHLGLWDLVKDAFGAVELERHQVGPNAFHIEARIGDSMIVLETADPPHPHGTPGSIYVYVLATSGGSRPTDDHAGVQLALAADGAARRR